MAWKHPDYGHQVPRLYTKPLRELTEDTSLGFAVIEFAEEILRLSLLPWQKWLLIHALELVDSTNGSRLRFRTVLTLVGRQNGKSYVTKPLLLFFMYIKQVGKIIGCAQSLNIAESLWEDAVEMALASEVIASDVIKVHRANGGKRLIVDVGDGLKAEYRVESASRRGGRGLSGDLILLDELREQTSWDAWSAITKTTLTKDDGLIWAITNAGDSTSVVLEYLRDMAHVMLGDPDGRFGDDVPDFGEEAAETSLGFFEWSAPPEADPADPETWAYANPSLGYLIQWESLRDSQLTDPPGVFLTECLCQWVTKIHDRSFTDGAWKAAEDAGSFIDEFGGDFAPVFGVDVSADRKHASIAVAGRRPDGDAHVELVAYSSSMSFVESWFRKRVEEYEGMTVCVQGRGCPASSLISSLEAVPGLSVIRCQGEALTASCGAFYDAVEGHLDQDKGQDRLVWHLPQPGLDIAAEVVQMRRLGDGEWAWDRKSSRDDVSPLCAATWAFGYLTGVYGDVHLVDEGPARKETSMKAPGRTRALLTV